MTPQNPTEPLRHVGLLSFFALRPSFLGGKDLTPLKILPRKGVLSQQEVTPPPLDKGDISPDTPFPGQELPSFEVSFSNDSQILSRSSRKNFKDFRK